MTTGQIVIVAILFGLFIISSAAGIFQRDKDNREACIIVSMFFTSIITILLVGVTVNMNELLSNNSCSKLERLENVYRLK